ncbi:MAG: hypothetical protein ABW020_01225 [Candidatus Rokuibacteriota bacterium]
MSERVLARLGGGLPMGVALAVLLALLMASADAQTLLDFVTLDGIDYIRWADEPGRALAAGDLGGEFATIACSVGEDSRTCSYGLDAAAAFMPAGSRVYAVRGYATEFRLAVTWRDRIFLYQAWRNPRARVGAQLYPLEGKVVAIDVQVGAATPPSPRRPSRVAAEGDVRMLVDLVLRGAVRPARAAAAGEPRYWLTFWLADGTTLDRPYAPSTGELMGGVVVSAEFRQILARYADR